MFPDERSIRRLENVDLLASATHHRFFLNEKVELILVLEGELSEAGSTCSGLMQLFAARARHQSPSAIIQRRKVSLDAVI